MLLNIIRCKKERKNMMNKYRCFCINNWNLLNCTRIIAFFSGILFHNWWHLSWQTSVDSKWRLVSDLWPTHEQANEKLSFPQNSELRVFFRNLIDSNFSSLASWVEWLPGIRQKWLPFRYMMNIRVYSGYQRLFLFVTFPVC